MAVISPEQSVYVQSPGSEGLLGGPKVVISKGAFTRPEAEEENPLSRLAIRLASHVNPWISAYPDNIHMWEPEINATTDGKFKQPPQTVSPILKFVRMCSRVSPIQIEYILPIKPMINFYPASLVKPLRQQYPDAEVLKPPKWFGTYPVEPEEDVEGMVKELEAFGKPPFFIVSHSWGVLRAAALSYKHPDLVSGVWGQDGPWAGRVNHSDGYNGPADAKKISSRVEGFVEFMERHRTANSPLLTLAGLQNGNTDTVPSGDGIGRRLSGDNIRRIEFGPPGFANPKGVRHIIAGEKEKRKKRPVKQRETPFNISHAFSIFNPDVLRAIEEARQLSNVCSQA